MSLAGFVLAGGASSRFGHDKAAAEIGGKTMLVRMCELLAAVCDGDVQVIGGTSVARDGFKMLKDRWPGAGPLGGIITGLQASANRHERNLIVGCDMPFLSHEWLKYLGDRAERSSAEVLAPMSKNGLEPLSACWRTSGRSKLQVAFDGGVRKITEAMSCLEMEVIDEREWKRFDEAGRLFWNMNTPSDYEEAKGILEGKGA